LACLLTGLLVPAFSSITFAQSRATTAELTGIVFDHSGAVVPGALVTATNADTNAERTTKSNGEGLYIIPGLPPGTYTIRAELKGFKTAKWDGIVLALGTTSAVNLVLLVSNLDAEVDVVLAQPIDPAQTTVSTVISQRQIESLPINGRNFISFSVITPGVSIDATPQQGASATSGLSFGGQRGRSNNITVDGVDNNDPTIGSVRATFSQEAVQEFQVLTNSFSAEFGKASGGVVNIVTKSGTNTTTGSAFFYGRDKALNARNHFEEFDPDGSAIDRDKAPFRQAQFGGTMGGPLARDRTFYFASFERLDQTASNFVNIDDKTLVPSPIGGPPLGTALGLLRANGFTVEEGNVPYAVTSDALLLKLDQRIGPTQTLSVRYNYGDALNENIEPFGGQVARSRAAVLDSTDNMVAASHSTVIGERMFNELRFQFARRDQVVRSLDPTCNGICDLDNEGGPTVEITGIASVGRQRFTPQPRLNNRIELLDTLTWVKDVKHTQHTLRAGFDFNHIDHEKQALPLHFGGRYIFVPFTPAQSQALGLPPIAISAMQAFALGIPARYVQGYGDPSQPYGYRDVSLFAQDDIRLTPQITVKAGIRYQRQFWPDFQYSIAGYPTPYGYPSDGNDIAPRVAAAWSDSKNSVHAAYGLFYDNQITGMAGIARVINGGDKVSTLVAGPPASVIAWRAPGRIVPRSAAPAVFPSLVIAIDPGLRTPYAPVLDRLRAPAAAPDRGVGRLPDRPRLRPARHDRLQPARPRARRQPPARGHRRRARDVRVDPAIHLLRRDLVQRPDAVGAATVQPTVPIPGQLHAVESRRQLDRLPERLPPAKQRRRPRSIKPDGPAARLPTRR